MDNIYVTKPSIPSFEEYAEEIKSIWETMHITNFGPKYKEFVGMLKDRFGYENIDCECNGHMTLQNILSTIEEGEIITTPFTFVSTTLAIMNSDHTPVFCDIREDDYNIDVDKIEELITDKTVAIVPVHVYGNPCDVERINEIAKKHNLKVVYDAAHAFNMEIDGVPIGKFGDASMFSFHATKVFNSIEGGMCVTNSEEMLKEVIARSNFGLEDGDCVYNAVNSKMNEYAACMGIVNLRHLDEYIEKRKKAFEGYDERLKDNQLIRILKRKDNIKYNYAYYPILLDEKINIEEFVKFLQEKKIFTRRYFYPVINEMKICKGKQNTPVAKKISEHILCLPMYADLSEEEVTYICDCIDEYLSKSEE